MRLKPGTERAWMCAFLDPRAEVAICGKTTQARQNGPGARPGASSILGVAYTIFGSDRGMAIGLT
jgi:hypothetical protein